MHSHGGFLLFSLCDMIPITLKKAFLSAGLLVAAILPSDAGKENSCVFQRLQPSLIR